MTLATITPRDLHAQSLAGKPVLLIDVRTPAEFQELHAAPATSIPLDQLDPSAAAALRAAPDQPLYVICRSGSRGRQGCEKLVAAGVTNVINVEGGTLAWEQAGLPVVRGKATISLERQVRIAAGSLVLLGVILAVALHPAFIALSGFVGAGLVFAGVTDTCGMGLLLAKMPWNQVSCSACSLSAPTSR
jgi:rhodanese-related sulfurtransferase